MTSINLAFEPIRQAVYTPEELFAGFDLAHPSSWKDTLDFKIYRQFVANGGNRPVNPYEGMMQSLHDCMITEAMDVITSDQKVCAIMGDHALGRNSRPYLNIALLAQRLTTMGYFICTGGGPGAMELREAVNHLSSRPDVPDLKDIILQGDVINEGLVKLAHAWFSPAYELFTDETIKDRGKSLAIPTWLYGSEPPTLFAAYIAKYFQNSIREDGLVSIADHGIIFSEGRAGTIQEIFQDATQNYYRTFKRTSPMVLLGKKHWTQDYPVMAVLNNLFAGSNDIVTVTDDTDEAIRFIEKANLKNFG
jgi:predicted Rossmann-fold nucleotide-binding protein